MRHEPTDKIPRLSRSEALRHSFGPSSDDGEHLFQVNPHAPAAFVIEHVHSELLDLYALAQAEAEKGGHLLLSLIAKRLDQVLATLGVAVTDIERRESR
jgi:hypothetical protein